MRIKWFLIIYLALFVFSSFLNFSWASGPLERKIVVFRPEVSQEERLDLLSRHQARFSKNLNLINGAAVEMVSWQVDRLAQEAKVLRVDPDVEVYALPLQERQIPDFRVRSSQGGQTIPWGVSRIDADNAWNVSSGSGIKVAIVDTGINRSHPDLNDNLAGCFNFISPRKTCEDDNGHGTHVAGIIAAENNNIGVVGVAPNAKVYALKVLDRWGSGYLSDIIEALDWSVQNKMQVVNMSLGTSSNITSFQDAVRRVNNAGIVQVAAAGNSGPGANTVSYPAKYPEVIAVSATDLNDSVPSWSSRGPEIDLAAPGVNIYSTYLRGTYKTLSGTSMSSPHVAGVVALRLEDHSGETPAIIESVLEANTNPLPFDPTLVGAGLVNAYKVVAAP